MLSGHPREEKRERNLVEYVLYVLAASVLAAISFSFVLWLRN